MACGPTIMNKYLLYLIFVVAFFPKVLLAQVMCKDYKLVFCFDSLSFKKVYIGAYDHSNYNLIDSFIIDSKKKNVSIKSSEPKLLRLTVEKTNQIIMVNCGSNFVSWNIEANKFIPKNNRLNEYWLEYDSLVTNKARWDLFNLMQFNNEKNERIIDSINQLRNEITKRFEEETRQYIRRYRNSFFSIFLLKRYYRSWDFDSVKYLYDQLNKSVKKYHSAIEVDSFLTKTSKYFRVDRLVFFSNEPVTRKFNYYVIDFWGSWCIPCIAALPALKALIDSTKDKNVQVISVAYETSDDLSKYYDALKKYDMTWPQVLAQKKGANMSIINENFITQYPTYLLADKNYKIIYRSSSPDALEKIILLLNNKLSQHAR